MNPAIILARWPSTQAGQGECQKTSVNQAFSDASGPNSRPSDFIFLLLPDDLITLIRAWSNLPEPVKAGIVAMVKAMQEKGW